MNSTQERPRRSPEAAAAAVDRASRLRSWMASHRWNGRPISQAVLSDLTGLAESVISGIFAKSGMYRDLAGLRAENIGRLVDGMRKVDPTLTGESIARLINIPEDRMDRWRGAEGPVDTRQATGYIGHAYLPGPTSAEGLFAHAGGGLPMPLPVSEAPIDIQPYMLQAQPALPTSYPLMQALQGCVTAPAGWTVALGPDWPGGAVLWLLAGLPWALPAGAVPGQGWTRIGSIRGVMSPG